MGEAARSKTHAPLEDSIPQASLESILCTEELQRRPSRRPDYEKENRGLVALVGALSDSPSTIFQTLAETILDITQCDSAGLSLLTRDGKTPDVGGERFYWPAIAGMWNPHVGGGTPRNFGPCGDVLDQNRTLLFTHFERRYPYLLRVIPAAEECLLVPFYVAGNAVGTIWAIMHSERRKFDAEDDRVMAFLGKFASSAYQAWMHIEDLKIKMVEREKAEAELRELADGLDGEVQARTAELQRNEERLRLAQHAARIGTFEWNIQAGVNTWTPELEEMYGLPPGGFGGTQTAFENLVHPDDRAGIITLNNTALKSGLPTEGEWRVVWPDGSVHWIRGRWQVFMNESGEPSRMIGVNADITQRKLVEESRFRLAAIVESSDDAIISENLDAIITSWNTGAQRIFGYTEPEAVGQVIAILIPPELRDEENKILERLRAGENINHYETVRVTKAGKKIDMSLSISPIKDSTCRIVGFCKIARDITERKLAQEALRASEERFRLATEVGKMYAYEWDVRTDVVTRSSEHIKVLGLRQSLQFSHQHFVEKIHPDDRPKFLAAIAALTPENPTGEVTYRALDSNASLVWLKSNGRGFFDREGRMLRVVGMVADVTNQKLAEEGLRASEGRLRLAQQAARIGTFERDVRTGRITWAEGLESLYGLPPGSVHGKTTVFFNDLIHPADRERTAHLIQQALKTGQPTEGEWRAIWPDGSVHWIVSRWQVLMDDSGEPSRVVGVNMDVTERKLAEQALHAQEELLNIFVKNVPAAIAMLDRDMRYLQVSDRWCTDYLSGREQVIGRSHYEIFPDMPERWKEVHRRALAGETLRADEDHWVGQDGPHWARWEVRPWKTHKSTVEGILILTEDITRRKRAEEALAVMTRKLIQAQEQERARIARELHDDVSQRLALLAVELEQLRQNPFEVEDRMQELRKQTSEISKDVQALSHDLHSSKLEYLGVVSGLKSWCKEFGERQKMEIDFTSHVPGAVPSDVGHTLYRLLQEALYNASKHSGVRRAEVQLREDSGEIHLIVSDRGRGFDVEAALQGKGLGLTSMRERVRLLAGTIEFQSKPMTGTTIHVRLPLPSMDSRRVAV